MPGTHRTQVCELAEMPSILTGALTPIARMVHGRALVSTLVVASNASHELLPVGERARFHLGNEVQRSGAAKR